MHLSNKNEKDSFVIITNSIGMFSQYLEYALMFGLFSIWSTNFVPFEDYIGPYNNVHTICNQSVHKYYKVLSYYYSNINILYTKIATKVFDYQESILIHTVYKAKKITDILLRNLNFFSSSKYPQFIILRIFYPMTNALIYKSI